MNVTNSTQRRVVVLLNTAEKKVFNKWDARRSPFFFFFFYTRKHMREYCRLVYMDASIVYTCSYMCLDSYINCRCLNIYICMY